MNRLFRLDNPVWIFLGKVCDLVTLSFLWMLFSLPVVTAGPSTAALYHTVHTAVLGDRGRLLPTFWRSFRTNLAQGVILTLGGLLGVVFIAVCWTFAGAMGQDSLLGVFYRIVSVVAGVLLWSGLLYLFPMLSRFYMKLLDLLKASFALAVTRLGYTLLLAALALAAATLMYVIPITCLILPGLVALAAERLLEPAFRKALASSQKAENSTTGHPEA